MRSVKVLLIALLMLFTMFTMPALGKPKVDVLLDALMSKEVTTKNAHKAFPKKLVNVYAGWAEGEWQVLVDVFIQASPDAILKLKNMGVNIRTVTSSGIMTATVPLKKINAIAALSEVTRIEAGQRVRKYMDVSRGQTGLNITGQYPTDGPTGAGVVVGVIDTGIDWSHPDFMENGLTRIHAVWDQSDYTDRNPPRGTKPYGYVYDATAIQKCIGGTGYCAQKDTDGHGTHVAGTAAGNGNAHGYGSYQYQFAGVAPEATLVVVKFDFDGTRNSTISIIDAIDWIFQKAAKLGKPAVINMSLGNDYGPHDGTTLEERSIDDLTGAGKNVVVAAGNPGATGDDTWGNLALWGYPLHGSSVIPKNSYSVIKLDIPPYTVGSENYVFFDIWYGGKDKTQIQIKTPSGKLYPPNFIGRYKNTWKTGSRATYFKTPDGSILVGNGGDEVGGGTNNGDNELYIEISDYNNIHAPADGKWEIMIYDRGLTEGGTYNGWHGMSSNLTLARPYYDDIPTDNVMTIGNPATANNVLAIGAYTTRMGWEYEDLNPNGGICSQGTPCCQIYNDYPDGPLSYYDPFYIDEYENNYFNYNFAGGGHSCYYDDSADSAEPFNGLAFFSAWGPTRDGRTKPEVTAPGVGIVASLSQDCLEAELSMPVSQTYFIRTNRIFADSWHAVLQGTSMSCPHVTGSVALLLAADGSLTPSEVRNILQNTARADTYTGTVPNNKWGYGKVDVTKALATLVCTSNVDCNASNDCTTDTCIEGKCQNNPVVHCFDGDGCCPAGCNSNIDNDCAGETCGNGYCAGAALHEDCPTCKADCPCIGKNGKNGCCGNGKCDKAETIDSCPVDCQ